MAAISMLLLVASCSGRGADPWESGDAYVARTGAAAGLTVAPIATGSIPVLGAWQCPPAGAGRALVLRIYLEGDGRNFVDGRPTGDPTPRYPLALHLAIADRAPARAWLARPCQYHPAPGPSACSPDDWIDARYGPRVTGAVDAAVSALVERCGATAVDLVGFSGGGVVAALVAAERRDVRQLVTVAAPLDTAAWTRAFGVSPIPTPNSARPIDRADRLAGLPQRHFAGGRDRDVPAVAQAGYFAALRDRGAPSAATSPIVVPDASHDGGWIERWPELLRQLGVTAPAQPGS